jgi:hypothetical protein
LVMCIRTKVGGCKLNIVVFFSTLLTNYIVIAELHQAWWCTQMNKEPGLKQIAIETTLTLPTSQLLRSFSSLEGVCHAGTHVACSRQRTAEAEPGG